MNSRLKISHKLLLSTLLILFASYATLIFTTIRSIDSTLEERINRELGENLKYAKNQYLNRATQIRYALEHPASSPLVQQKLLNKDSAWLRTAITRWTGILPYIDVMLVVDSRNQVLARSNSERSGDVIAIASALEKAYQEKHPVISTEIVPNEFLCNEGMAPFCAPSQLHEAMMVTVVVPLITESGAVIGAIIAGDVLNHDFNIPYQVQEIFGKEVIVSITQWGLRVATNLREDFSAADVIPPDILGQLKRGVPFRGKAKIGRRIYKTAIEPITNGKGSFIGTLSVAISEQDFKKMLHDSLRNILLSACIGIVLTFWLAYYSARRLTKPLHELAIGVQNIEAGDLSQRVHLDSTDELGILADAFNRMAGSLHERDRIITTKTVDLEQLNRRLKELNELLERKVADRTSELLVEKGRLETILTSMAEGVIVTDGEGRVILFNPAAQKIFDMVPYRIIGQPIAGFRAVREVGRLVDCINQIKDEGANATVREEELSVAGKKLKISVSPLIDDSGAFAGVVMSIRDVTIEEQVDRMKSEFISTVSHELKTPLTSMKGSLQFMLSKAAGLQDMERELLQICLRNTDRLIRLISDILDISGIESGGIEFSFKPLPIRPLVSYSIDELNGFAREHQISIHNLVDENLPEGFGDHDRLIQVLTNLLSNAVKFSPEGEVIAVTAKRAGNHLAVSVADRGREIQWADREKLFRKFQQLDGSDRRQHGGTGLGLAICKDIIEKHHGRIYYETGADGGNVFTFTVPIAEEGV